MAMPAATEFDAQRPVVDAIRAGDRRAFAEFVRSHDKWVRGVVFGVLGSCDDIDDVCQQVWITFWRRIGELRDTSSWRSWLYRLSRNAAIDAGREKTRRRTRFPSTSIEGVEGQVPAGGPRDETRERYEAVLGAIGGLPVLYREPFVMKHMNGWSYKQISEALGLPVDTVETRLVRARRLLREALKEQVVLGDVERS